jgi:protoporphyrinogen IX oxidase
VRQLFNLMENRLYKVIMMPSMVLTLILGGTLLVLHWGSVHQSGWIWLKLILVIFLVCYHHYCGALIRRLAPLAATDPQPHTDKFLRVFNEIPALLLIIIVFLAVIRPF